MLKKGILCRLDDTFSAEILYGISIGEKFGIKVMANVGIEPKTFA